MDKSGKEQNEEFCIRQIRLLLLVFPKLSLLWFTCLTMEKSMETKCATYFYRGKYIVSSIFIPFFPLTIEYKIQEIQLHGELHTDGY